MLRIQRQKVNALHSPSPHKGVVVARGAVLGISCGISYWLITHILADIHSISRDDDILGGMWAVAATIFVYRYSHADSVRAALSRMAATSASFALCLSTSSTSEIGNGGKRCWAPLSQYIGRDRGGWQSSLSLARLRGFPD
jgi:hypothetical protein